MNHSETTDTVRRYSRPYQISSNAWGSVRALLQPMITRGWGRERRFNEEMSGRIVYGEYQEGIEVLISPNVIKMKGSSGLWRQGWWDGEGSKNMTSLCFVFTLCGLGHAGLLYPCLQRLLSRHWFIAFNPFSSTFTLTFSVFRHVVLLLPCLPYFHYSTSTLFSPYFRHRIFIWRLERCPYHCLR